MSNDRYIQYRPGMSAAEKAAWMAQRQRGGFVQAGPDGPLKKDQAIETWRQSVPRYRRCGVTGEQIPICVICGGCDVPAMGDACLTCNPPRPRELQRGGAA